MIKALQKVDQLVIKENEYLMKIIQKARLDKLQPEKVELAKKYEK